MAPYVGGAVDLQAIAWEAKRGRERNRQVENSRSGRDIGELPPVVDQARRDACAFDLRLYLETYHADAFGLEWSEDHLDFIAETQRAILEGTLKAQAMPRGSGKTTIFERAIIWAVIYGHVPFACIIAATEEKAAENLESIRSELEQNELLGEDFPEVCFPIRKLERIANRARGQTYRGEPTRIVLKDTKIVLPTIPGSKASSGVISATGITGGNIRGQKHRLPDGRIVRPKVALVDDPQTRKSAASSSENVTRSRILNGDVMGMAGPGETISVLAAVTVIYRADTADRLLNRTINPRWRGKRCKLLYAMPSKVPPAEGEPSAMELWDRYGEMRANEIRADGDGSEATAFYAANRKAMDDGAVEAWPARKLDGELSALQHAMNLYYDNREAFFAEYQNEPLDEAPDGDDLLTAPQIMTRLSLVKRRVVPLDVDHLVAHIDPHKRLLYWTVCGFSAGYRGYVVDYGTWPEQPVPYFTLRDARVTLADIYPKATEEGAIRKGLEDLTEEICAREWEREANGGTEQLSLVLVDEGYLDDVVQKFCRRSTHKRVLRTSKGWAVKAGNAPMNEWREFDGERKGDNWRLRMIDGVGVRRVLFDPNPWKSFAHKRLSAADGDPSSLVLFGDDPKRHELFADHLSAEFRVQTEGRGRKVDEWKPRPAKPDNHFFDNLVGCTVAASVLGCKLPDTTTAKRRREIADEKGEASKPKRRRRRGMTYAEGA